MPSRRRTFLRPSAIVAATLVMTGALLTACQTDDQLPSGTSTTGGGQGGNGGSTSSVGGGGATTSSASQGGGGAATTSSSGGPSSGGSGGSGGGTGGSGAGGGGACNPGADPVLMSTGDADKVLLQGTIVLPGQNPNVLVGEVLVVGDMITCVAASCANSPGAASASVVKTNGIIVPGLVDSHNHVLFNTFDDDDWSAQIAYADHDGWSNDSQDIIDAKQWLNGEVYKNGITSPVKLGCELGKYGEIKAVIAGTTSVLGHIGTATGNACFGSLARTLSDNAADFPFTDKIQVSALTPPSSSTANSVCSNYTDGDTNSFVIHLGEGVLGSPCHTEWAALKAAPTSPTNGNMPGCLNVSKTTLVHANAFNDAELAEIAAAGMSIVASVHVQVSLYGLGTDYSVTTNIPKARSLGINVGIGPDWSLGGSINMLDELRWVELVDAMEWGDVLTPEDIVEMATMGSAKAMQLQSYIGSIAVGKFADIAVIRGDTANPYDAILAAQPDDVVLTMVNGVSIYGDMALKPLGPANPGCETLDLCCGPKFLCVAEAGGTAANKLGQTLPQIVAAIEDGYMQSLPADNYQQYLPIAPLFKCQ